MSEIREKIAYLSGLKDGIKVTDENRTSSLELLQMHSKPYRSILASRTTSLMIQQSRLTSQVMSLTRLRTSSMSCMMMRTIVIAMTTIAAAVTMIVIATSIMMTMTTAQSLNVLSAKSRYASIHISSQRVRNCAAPAATWLFSPRRSKSQSF